MRDECEERWSRRRRRRPPLSSSSLYNILLLPFSCMLVLLHASLCHGCMPGYEYERSRLRQYLGIEWIPGALDQMDTQQLRHIRHPSDLDCDFANPDQCKWRNVRGLDTLDFFLFRKEDNTEFPVVHIRPGPSKVPVGDQMLLTGDRKRDEQVALLASHPIKCQNTTGTLTFTFWVYNGARVEVVILEERDEGLVALPEKPQIDCGTVHMNTECTVSIPPSLQPFQLGLRAYDIRNTEGSLVMLDNINYDAQFCKISIDFGLMDSEPLLGGARGEPVRSLDELNCADFGPECRWRQSGRGKAIWKRAIGSAPSPVMLLNETGTNQIPDLPSAFFYLEEGGGSIAIHHNVLDAETTEQFRMLISDPIQCYGQSTVGIKFRIWMTKGIKLAICILEAESLKENTCQPVASATLSPAPVQHSFQLNMLKFVIAFRVDSVNKDFDHFVLLDNFELEGGDLCGDLAAKSENRLMDQFLPVPMLSTLLNRPIHSASELYCDFSKRAIACRWANPERLSVEVNAWEIGVKKRDGNLFDGDIALARLDHHNSTAYLLSETIQCILDGSSGGATLSLRTWYTGGARLAVCIVRAHSMEVLDCQMADGGHGTEEQVLVDIPSTDEPVKLLLRAEASGKPGRPNGGQVAVDDIVLEARVCPSTASAIVARGVPNSSGQRTELQADPGAFASSEKTHPVPDENVCRLLSCDFDHDDSMCLYSSSRVSSSLSLFRTFNRSASTMLFERNRVAMIESPLFHLNAPARLHFDFSIKKGSANLHICQDSVMRELDSCYAVFEGGATAGWLRDYIELTETDRKVYIIARLGNGARKSSVQIDNLLLTDVEDHKAC